MHRSFYANRGFTILELMLTVLLVGILFAIAVPAYDSYRERVRSNQAAREISELGASVQRFALDNRAFPDTLEQIGAAGRLDP